MFTMHKTYTKKQPHLFIFLLWNNKRPDHLWLRLLLRRGCMLYVVVFPLFPFHIISKLSSPVSESTLKTITSPSFPSESFTNVHLWVPRYFPLTSLPLLALTP